MSLNVCYILLTLSLTQSRKQNKLTDKGRALGSYHLGIKKTVVTLSKFKHTGKFELQMLESRYLLERNRRGWGSWQNSIKKGKSNKHPSFLYRQN